MPKRITTPLTDEQSKLAAEHIGLVHMIARRYRGRGLSYEELVAICEDAVMGATRRFDPARGKFSTYAVWRMRQTLRRTLALKYARQEANSPREAQQLDTKNVSGWMVDEGRTTEGAPLEVKELYAKVMGLLTDRERFVLVLNEIEGVTLKDIGDILDLTRERIRQIHAKAIEKCRAKLAA